MATRTKEVFNLDGLAEYLDVSKSTLYKLAQRGGVPGHKVGKQWRFHKNAIDEWLRQQFPKRVERDRKTCR
jgi:excisionase family DNA binding protein